MYLMLLFKKNFFKCFLSLKQKQMKERERENTKKLKFYFIFFEEWKKTAKGKGVGRWYESLKIIKL